MSCLVLSKSSELKKKYLTLTVPNLGGGGVIIIAQEHLEWEFRFLLIAQHDLWLRCITEDLGCGQWTSFFVYDYFEQK